MIRTALCVLIILASIPSWVDAQVDTVFGRYRQYLLDASKAEHDIHRLVTTISTTGQWPDINYADQELSNWKNLIHLKRVRDLALVWKKPGSSWSQNPHVWQTFLAGLDHWLQKRYRNANWWHNEIGVPQCMRDIIFLVREDLNPERLNAAKEVMAQHRVQESGVGANLTWSADLGFHYAVLNGDLGKMEFCRNLILKEIRISTEEGVQPDFSFHQHGPRLQMYQYGRAFLWENIRLAWELRGTPLAFPKEKVDILAHFTLQGWQWMARGIHTVPGTMDRSASRVRALTSANLVDLVPYLLAVSPENKKAIERLAAIQRGESALYGYRHYPRSDFTAYHRSDFSFFLKTISSRTLPTESINSENLKGSLLNSGDAYLIKDGQEYFNLMPVWNWAQLPGVTAFTGAEKISRKSFVGSVTDGTVGLTAMDYELESKDNRKSLTAKKFWASAGEQVVCLIADLRGNGITDAYTTLDQCRYRGGETVHASWVYHSGFAYLSLDSSRIDLQRVTATGTWKAINAAESRDQVTEQVFMPVLHHEVDGKRGYGYALAACRNSKEADKLASNPKWTILRNDGQLQAVRFHDGTLMAAFYEAGMLDLQDKGRQIGVNQPCLVLIRDRKVWLSKPADSSVRVTVNIYNKQIKIVLPAEGKSVKMPL